jgi:uncharacterized cupin superfamily protein
MTAASNLKRIPLNSKHFEPSGGGLKVTSSSLHRTTRSSLGVWEYATGTFDWHTEADHSACVIEGSARVELSDGRTVRLEPGTTLYVPRGTRGRWRVEATLRTVALNHG